MTPDTGLVVSDEPRPCLPELPPLQYVKAICPLCGWQSEPFEYRAGWPPRCGNDCGTPWATELKQVERPEADGQQRLEV